MSSNSEVPLLYLFQHNMYIGQAIKTKQDQYNFLI